MSGGEPSSIKQKPSCAAELPILSPNRGKAAGRALSNWPRAVLWGAERKDRGTSGVPYMRKQVPEKLVFDTPMTPPKAAGSGDQKSGAWPDF